MCPVGKSKEISNRAEEKGQDWDVLEGMYQCQS